MTELILLLALWPFHHKPNGIVSMGDDNHVPHGYTSHRIQIDAPECDKSGNVWFYTEEGVTGIGASCEAAKKDYNSAHIDPVRMSRS